MRSFDTERLTIRRFIYTDWLDLHDYLSDPEVVRFEPYEPFDCEASKAECKRRSKDPSFWAVELKSEHKVIGNIYFARGDFETCELGYVFNRAYWRMGYAKEACRALIDHAFSMLGVHRVVAMCNPANESSWRLMESLGMRREAVHMQNIWFKKDENGEPVWQDTYEYAVLRGEWKSGVHPGRGE